MKRYHGAGILFFTMRDSGVFILLAQRRRSGVWSLPGGGCDGSDADLWETAQRETNEEFGSVPSPHEVKFSLTYPFGIFGFQWTTFVLEVPDPPLIDTYPNRQARDFASEFRNAVWFPISALPPKTHCLLYPVVWKMRMRWL